MSLKKALLAATVLSLPIAAQAQPVTGIYVGAGAGGNYLHSTKDNGVEISTDIGYIGVLSVGYGFGNGLRLEVEGSFRSNEGDRADIRIPGLTSRANLSGNVRSYGAMVNAIYEFSLGPVQPYIGAGVGYIWQDVDLRGRGPGSTLRLDDTDGAFGFQGIAGLAFPIPAVPGLAITAEYRFLGTTGHEYRVAGLPGNRYEMDNYNHSILAGIRYNFGQVAAAAPAPAPVPQATARTYLVFFDWDRADLTDRARQIIAEAAAAAPSVNTTRIEVAGHADRSGTPAYNQRLSERRANNVAAELVRRGIARNLIAISAFGETRPLVPTADGVREPQNRRVEIVLR
ncbi:OmpA family protein [Plastoroseomonas hellenica]|uniref:OmpA family protein n=1 Tax=Plastoroseomonas hellenica TaxID=2687306 RepID=UPI001BAD8475|nr:outer membrane beta-barrel protein [Plastoroseomonas hellenica]MBR0642159.1 OmpA family protein [Plastoroseomonas hellenica]